jgi:hypothetical protein
MTQQSPTYAEIKMLVPCPKHISGMEKIVTTFSLSVWLTMGLVFLLTTAVCWCVANGPYQSTFKELQTYKSVSHCFYNAWAVYMGVSVTQLPTTSKLRVFFIIYVCYYFAMSTVFQAFFVSYLVEPQYGKEIKTLDELLHSDIIYSYHLAIEFALHKTSYTEMIKFYESKELRKDCSDVRKCIEQLITERDITSVCVITHSFYVASEMGIADPSHVICSLDEHIFSGGSTILFKKGNPFYVQCAHETVFGSWVSGKTLVRTEVSSLFKK